MATTTLPRAARLLALVGLRVAHHHRSQEDRRSCTSPPPSSSCSWAGSWRWASAPSCGPPPATGSSLIPDALYNQLFTMHGTTMIFLFVMPMMTGFANYIVPLQIGAADMAFPRINALVVLDDPASAACCSSAASPFGGAAAAGWTGYAPLSEAKYRRRRPDLLDPGPAPARHQLDPGRDQLPGHHLQAARAGHDAAAHAHVRVDRARDQRAAALLRAGPRRPA